jgi:signal transduction histidine kinase
MLDQPAGLWNVIEGVSHPSSLAHGSVQGHPAGAAGASFARAGEIARCDARRDASDPARAKGRPVLVLVDDEPDVLLSVQDLLRMDYEVHAFRHGAEALEFLRNAPRVHVILSDQRMPGISGVEVLRDAMAIRPETTRLLFTAYSDLRAVVDAINQGNVFRFLAKPYDPDLLSAVVRQAVEHHDLIVEKNALLAELQESNAKLLEANRIKGAFIEVVSHELNTPLTVVLGMIDLWRMSQGATATPVERQWVERIGAAAGRLARTVDRMLKLVRNRDFTQSLDIETVELGPIAERVVEELSPYLELRRQEVTVRLDPQVGSIEVDPSKIADVLINLLANAVKFTPDCGTIRLEARPQPNSHDEVRVEVTDEGVGVPQSEQEHLFEPFFTGFDTLRHSSGEYEFGKRGIGLGLCLVKTFVQLHGGRVEVSSTPGSGSTFAFVLPRSQSNRVRE